MDKMPTDRYKDARRLASFLRLDGPRIAEALEPAMTAVLEEGEKLPDLAHLLDVLGRMVVAEQANLDRQDDVKRRHNTNAYVTRLELRRDAMPMLRSRMKEVRKWMRSHLSAEEIEKVAGFKGRTPRSDEGLEDLAIAIVRGLSGQKPLETSAGTIDLDRWARYLREPLARTSGLLDDLDEELGERSQSAERKSRAMKTFDKLFRQVAGAARIFYRMAGLEKPAGELIYGGGRPGEKVKKGRGVA